MTRVDGHISNPLKRATVCGFSFGRNLSKLGYPVEDAVRSVLPLCDQFVFAVGASEDDTRQRVESIDPKVRIIDTIWPDVREDGKVLAIESNKALAAAQATGCTWGFYIQADEVVHEDDHPAIAAAMNRWRDEAQVKGLLFRFLHFVIDYETIDPWMYHKASRIVRLDGACEIVGDACGPAIKDYTGKVNRGNGYLDKHHLGGHVRWSGGRIFHYGWVKTPEQLNEKVAMIENLWWGTLDATEIQRRKKRKLGNFSERYPILKKYRAGHPRWMTSHVSTRPPHKRIINRWLNPRFWLEAFRHGYQG